MPMARSHRKTPICGMTAADSDKSFKRAEHRRERRVLRQTDLSETDPAPTKLFGNPWNSEKDGKQHFAQAHYPKLMRK